MAQRDEAYTSCSPPRHTCMRHNIQVHLSAWCTCIVISCMPPLYTYATRQVHLNTWKCAVHKWCMQRNIQVDLSSTWKCRMWYATTVKGTLAQDVNSKVWTQDVYYPSVYNQLLSKWMHSSIPHHRLIMLCPLEHVNCHVNTREVQVRFAMPRQPSYYLIPNKRHVHRNKREMNPLLYYLVLSNII